MSGERLERVIAARELVWRQRLEVWLTRVVEAEQALAAHEAERPPVWSTGAGLWQDHAPARARRQEALRGGLERSRDGVLATRARASHTRALRRAAQRLAGRRRAQREAAEERRRQGELEGWVAARQARDDKRKAHGET